MQNEVFRQLVDTYYASLYRFALSLTRSTADASDLTQQTFFIWATKGESLRESAKAKSWLFTTLYREFLRTRRRDARTSALEDLPPAGQDAPDLDPGIVDRLDASVVMEALQEVDQVFREPLTLFYLQDLSYVEIAEVLAVPTGTVMSRLSRGKAQLRLRLAERQKVGKVIGFPKTQARP